MLLGTEVTTDQLIGLRAQAHGLSLKVFQSTLSAGNARSMIRGRGMEYEESRKYSIGDDARTIDWRVTARTGTAHTKVFQEDRQRAVRLIVDMTSPMRFGTRTAFKSVVAAEAASIIAWAAFAQNDLVGTVAFSDSEIREIRPTSSVGALIRQFELLSKMSRENSDAKGNGNIGDALSRVSRQVRPGDMTVVFSDFSNLSDAARTALGYLNRRQSLIACWIIDVTEREALPVGRYPVTDGSGYATLHLSSAARRENLQQVLDGRCEEVEKSFRGIGAPIVRLVPGEDIAKAIFKIFRRKSALNRSKTLWKVSEASGRLVRTSGTTRF